MLISQPTSAESCAVVVVCGVERSWFSLERMEIERYIQGERLSARMFRSVEPDIMEAP